MVLRSVRKLAFHKEALRSVKVRAEYNVQNQKDQKAHTFTCA